MSKSLRTNFLQKRETLSRMKKIRKTLFLENNATVAESPRMPISLNERRRTARTLIQIDYSKPKTAKTFFRTKNSVNVECRANKFFVKERNTVEIEED